VKKHYESESRRERDRSPRRDKKDKDRKKKDKKDKKDKDKKKKDKKDKKEKEPKKLPEITTATHANGGQPDDEEEGEI
jgi:hypothetical protein